MIVENIRIERLVPLGVFALKHHHPLRPSLPDHHHADHDIDADNDDAVDDIVLMIINDDGNDDGDDGGIFALQHHPPRPLLP